ncbi:MAG TPA: hypothetical protein V6C97_23515 [Oculatellaceae cyanobacterium]
MTKHAFFLLTALILCSFRPSSAQSFDYDYSGMVPFKTEVSSEYLPDRTIRSIYRNPLNIDTSRVRNGLPPVTTDSFVYEAGGMAELIYGDEGARSLSPYFEFTPEHRIGAGIVGARAQGLTTGHSTPLPSTWGGDEFYMPESMWCFGQPVQAVPMTPEAANSSQQPDFP